MDEIIEFDIIENEQQKQQQQRKSSEAVTETTVLATPIVFRKKLEARLPTITSNNFLISHEHQTRKDKYGLDQKSKSIDNSCLKSNSSLSRSSTKKRKVSLLRFSDDLATTSGGGGGHERQESMRGSLMRKKKYSLTPEHYKNLNFHHVETVVQTSLQPIKIKTVTSSSPQCEISTKILKPNDYFFLSIFTSLFCCFPIGK